MITAFTEGAGEVVTKLERLDARMTEELRQSISRLAFKLQAKVQNEKLSGQVLGVRTGRGKRSIHTDIRTEGQRVIGVVSTNVFYMIGWELGWPDAAQHASIAGAKGKFDVGSGGSFKNGSPKKRAFLIPALKEMNESGIIEADIQSGISRAKGST